MLVCLLMRLHFLLICLVRTAALIYILSHTLSLIPSQTRRILCHLMHYGRQQPRIQIEVLGHSVVRSLAPLTHSLAPDCSIRSRPPLRSLVRSLADFAYSLARGKGKFLMS